MGHAWAGLEVAEDTGKRIDIAGEKQHVHGPCGPSQKKKLLIY